MNIKIILDLFFPLRCVSCQKVVQDEPLCAACFASIPIHDTLFCGKCKARNPSGKKICHPEVPYLLASATDFHEPAVTALIHTLKFEYVSSAALPLARLTAEYLTTVLPEGFDAVIVPIPLSSARLRSRGFNQSELLAKHLATFLGLPLEARAVERVKNSPPQSRLAGAASRTANIAGCYAVKDADAVAGRNVLLVDDVTTSGATFTECARALRRAGAQRIIAVAAAKA